MFFDIIWKTYFLFLMFIALIPITIQYILLGVGLKELRNKYVYHYSRWWARQVILSSKSKVKVFGAENIPADRSVIFISNHQSLLDIPVLIGFLGIPVAFIAKKELKKVPILSTWMKVINCSFLDRKNPRNAIKTLNEAIKKYHKGQSLVLFPEGTRTKDGNLRPFKKGSMKLALKSDAVVLPLTIDGTRRLLEGNGFHINPVQINLHIHSPIDIKTLSDDEKKNLNQALQAIIENKLPEGDTDDS